MQPACQVPAFMCSQVPYLQPNQTWIPGVLDLNWAPNRMPAAWINLWPKKYCSMGAPDIRGNYRGLQTWWYADDDEPSYDGSGDPADSAFATLELKLTQAYNHGFRRIILNLPAGMVYEQNMSSAHWWSMPAWKRARLACLIQNWLISKPDTQFEIYGAFEINDSTSLCMKSNIYAVRTIVNDEGCDATGHGYMYYPCLGAAIAYPPSAFVQTDACEFHDNINPWQQLGISRYWLDYANHHWDAYVEFPYSPLYAPAMGEHHFLGAESVPHIHHGGFDYSIDIGRILYSPAIAINTMPTVNKFKTWDIHAYSAQTEVVAVIDHSEDEYWNINHMFDVLAWSQKGFVVAVQGVAVIGMPAVPATEIIEFVKRVYDFGPLADANDFNGDGLVDEHDVTDFNAMYAIYFGRTNCNWVHGDVNGDNTVTLADLLAFNSRRMIAGTPGTPGYTPIPINLGAADPYDALTRP